MDNRDMVLQGKGGQLQRINQNSSLYAALYYILLFPKGKNSQYPRIPICGAQLRERDKNMRQRKEKKRLTHSMYLIHAIMPIVYMLGKVLSYLSFMVESCSSNLLLMHGQIISKENSTRLEHISTLLDLSFIKDFRMMLYIIDIIVKILDLWDANLFFLSLM